MAPLPPNNTERWFVDYAVNGINHTLLIRTVAPSTNDVISTFVSDLFGALDDVLWATAINGLRRSVQGSDISLDQAYLGTTAFGGGVGDDLGRGYFLAYEGRSEGGRPVKLTVFGFKNLLSVADTRFPITSPSPYFDALGVIETTPGLPAAIDANNVIWKNYVNCGNNSYWQRQARKT